jgi:hypothetical protein
MVCALAGATFALGGFSIQAQALSPSMSILGIPRIGAPGVRETTAQIMARDRLQAAQPNVRHVFPRFVLPPVSSTTSTGQVPAVPASLAPSPRNAQTVSPTLNFTGATYYDCSGWPPDTMGAVGPTQFIIALNGQGDRCGR